MINTFSLSKFYVAKISFSFILFVSYLLPVETLAETNTNKTHANEDSVTAIPSFTNLQSYLIYSSFYLSSEQYQELTNYFNKFKISLDAPVPEISVEGKTIFLNNTSMSAKIFNNGIQVDGYTWSLKKFVNIESALDDLSRHLRSANKKTTENKLFNQKISIVIGNSAYAVDHNSIDLSYRIGAGLLTVASVALMSPVAIPAALAYTLAAAGGAAVINVLIESCDILWWTTDHSPW